MYKNTIAVISCFKEESIPLKSGIPANDSNKASLQPQQCIVHQGKSCLMYQEAETSSMHFDKKGRH